MTKTVEELKQQAKEKGITFYPVHRCSFCGYQCGFVIRGDEVAYDSGCDCVSYTKVEPRDWTYLAHIYNLNQPENNTDIPQTFLDELNQTWQFDLPVTEAV